MNIDREAWMLVERLCEHSLTDEEFRSLLDEFDISYSQRTFSGSERYTFMSQPHWEFADYMRDNVQSFKYPKFLEKVVFNPKVISTQRDGWNYYGEYIQNWYPRLIELIDTSGLKINESLKTIEREEEAVPTTGKFAPSVYGDRFLDFIREEINSTYKSGHYLSVMFLSRKLLEAVTVRVLEVVFPKIQGGEYNENNHQILYDRTKGKYHDFSYLLEKMKERSSDFHEDKGLIEEFVFTVTPFRKECNICVHHDYKTPDADYVTRWKTPSLLGMSHKLFRKYCNL